MKNNLLSIIKTAVITFIVFAAIQYVIIWYLLSVAGIAAGLFLLKTSDDRSQAIGILVGSAAFALFAYLMAQIYPITG